MGSLKQRWYFFTLGRIMSCCADGGRASELQIKNKNWFFYRMIFDKMFFFFAFSFCLFSKLMYCSSVQIFFLFF